MSNRVEQEEALHKEDLHRIVASIEQATGRKLFILVRSFDDLLPSIVENACRETLGNSENENREYNLDVLLHSNGGGADAAYKSMLIFRQFANHIRVLVPRRAKSAATLFALGSDEIIMWWTAELGPLDPQIVDPRNPIRPMSALDGYQSVEYIRDYALETLTVTVSQLLNSTGGAMPLSTAINHSTDFLKIIVSPIISQVNPVNFGEWGRNLDISKEYAERLLQRYHMKGKKWEEVVNVADRLVYNYPHHGFVIDISEAERLGLNVAPMSIEQFQPIDQVVKVVSNLVQPLSYNSLRKSEPGYTGFAPSSAYKGKHPQEGEVLWEDKAKEARAEADTIDEAKGVEAKEEKLKEVQASERDKSSDEEPQQSGLSPN